MIRLRCDGGDMDGRIGLAEAVAVLREELEAAMEAATGNRVRFTVGPVDLELTVEVARGVDGSGKVRFWVVEAGAGATTTSTTTQVVKIRLDPVDSQTGGPVAVSENDDTARRGDPARRSGPSPAVG